MIKLDNCLLIGKGSKRSCYQNPNQDDHCIKVVHTGGTRTHYRTLREIKYIKKYKSKNFKEVPNYYGKTKTNLGTGYIFEKVKDWNDKTSITLLDFINKDRNSIKIQNMISQMYNSFLAHRVVISDLNPGNIVVQTMKKDSEPYLVLIDGIGNSDFIKICDYSKFFYKKKLNRKFNELTTTLNYQGLHFKEK